MIDLRMPAEVYHMHPALSNSALSDFARSPYRYWALHRATGRPAVLPTAALEEGTVAHHALLQPELFAARYARIPLDRKGTKAWAEAEAANPGKVCLKAGEYDKYLMAAELIGRNELVAKLFGPGVETEVSCFWEDERGFQRKARLDAVRPGECVIDLKKSRSIDSFDKSALGYGYHRQAAWYTEAHKRCYGTTVPFYFVAFEIDYPFEVRIWQATEEFISAGRDEIEQIIPEWLIAERTGTWPDRTGPWELGLQSFVRG